jgi:hypothetical protein
VKSGHGPAKKRYGKIKAEIVVVKARQSSFFTYYNNNLQNYSARRAELAGG